MTKRILIISFAAAVLVSAAVPVHGVERSGCPMPEQDTAVRVTDPDTVVVVYRLTDTSEDKETEKSRAAEDATRKEQKIKVSGGPAVAFIGSNFVHSPMDGGRSTMKYGAGIGGFLDMGIKDWFSIQFELMFGYNESEFSRLGETGTFRHVGIEFPVYAMFHIPLKDKSQFNLGIGPFSNFGLHGIYETGGSRHDVYKRNNATGLSTMKDNYSGVTMKVGYEFRFGLQLNCCYKISLSNVLDENSSEVRMHPQTASFEIAYRF